MSLNLNLNLNLNHTLKCQLFLAVTFLSLSNILAFSKAQGSGFGCAGVAGSVIFFDTLYGTATGIVVAGVLEGVKDKHSKWEDRILAGAAIGAGVGLVLGGLEIGLRDCSESSRVNHTWLQPGWRMPQVVLLGKQSVDVVRNVNKSLWSESEIGPALKVSYFFP